MVSRATAGKQLRFAAAAILLLSTLGPGTSRVFGSQSVTLAWDRDPDPSVAGYNVYYGVASRTYTNTISVGDVTNATVAGLVEGVTYYFAGTEYDNTGLESDYSTEVTYTVPTNTVINQPPTLNPLNDRTINENSGPQTINLSGISPGATNESQTLTVTAVSSNPALMSNPMVNYTSPSSTGTLTLIPALNTFGSAIITVTVNDGQAINNSVSQSFVVTVNPLGNPTLAITSDSAGIRLQWPMGNTNYLLEATTNLQQPFSLFDYPKTTNTQLGILSVLITNPGPQMYFRLRNP